MTVDVSAKCGFLPPTADQPERPAVFVTLPHKRVTTNYSRFEIPFDRDVTAFNGQVYLTQDEWRHLGAPTRGVRIIIEALPDTES